MLTNLCYDERTDQYLVGNEDGKTAVVSGWLYSEMKHCSTDWKSGPPPLWQPEDQLIVIYGPPGRVVIPYLGERRYETDIVDAQRMEVGQAHCYGGFAPGSKQWIVWSYADEEIAEEASVWSS